MEIDIKEFIEIKIPELRERLYPVFTTNLDITTIVYQFVPISGGHVKQNQLELKIIGKSYDECKKIEEKLVKLLDQEEDAPFYTNRNTRFHSNVSGGGILFNDGCQMFEDTIYFIIDWRNINGNR